MKKYLILIIVLLYSTIGISQVDGLSYLCKENIESISLQKNYILQSLSEKYPKDKIDSHTFKNSIFVSVSEMITMVYQFYNEKCETFNVLYPYDYLNDVIRFLDNKCTVNTTDHKNLFPEYFKVYEYYSKESYWVLIQKNKDNFTVEVRKLFTIDLDTGEIINK